jgi:hypothetical protein
MGWTGDFVGYHAIENNCGNHTSDIEACIDLNTYNQTEAFKDVLIGFTPTQSLLDLDNIWTEDFTSTWNGRTYTLNIPKSIGPDDGKDQLFVAFGYNRNYKIFLHDPFYFALNENPMAFPSILLEIFPNETMSHFYRLALTEIEELDLPEDPCNPDRDYKFQACIKESLSRQVGCRTKWDQWSDVDLPLCTKMDQFR